MTTPSRAFLTLCFVFLYSLSLFGSMQSRGNACPSRELLGSFWELLFETTSAGYVIYGEKPVYLGNFCHPEWLMPGTAEHRRANHCLLALRVLGKYFSQHAQPTNYILINRGQNFSYPHEFMLINRKAVYNKIHENASLFKYNFGWDTSAESVLESLVSTDNGFLTLLRGKSALQGILLGYGVENSISYERSLYFRQALISTDPIHPPQQLAPFPKTITDELQESYFGNNSQWRKIREETKDFSAHHLRDREDGLNVFFSFHKNSKETLHLLEQYKKAQSKIDELLRGGQLLESTLARFGIAHQILAVCDEAVAWKFTDRERKMLPRALSRVIGYTFSNQISPEFFKGMEFADKNEGGDVILDSQELISFDVLREQTFSMECRKKNALLSREFLLTEAANKDMRCLIPGKLYTRTLNQGTQRGTITLNSQSLLANYIIRDMGGEVICGTYKGEPPERLELRSLIPGLAHGMLGMSEGEVREVHIHPDLAYGIYSEFGSGRAITVRLELVKIDPVSHQAQAHFPYLQPIDVRHFAPTIRTCEEFNALQRQYEYHCGMRTWMHYKKARSLLDLKEVMAQLCMKHFSPPSEEDRRMIARLNWMIYTN